VLDSSRSRPFVESPRPAPAALSPTNPALPSDPGTATNSRCHGQVPRWAFDVLLLGRPRRLGGLAHRHSQMTPILRLCLAVLQMGTTPNWSFERAAAGGVFSPGRQEVQVAQKVRPAAEEATMTFPVWAVASYRHDQERIIISHSCVGPAPLKSHACQCACTSTSTKGSRTLPAVLKSLALAGLAFSFCARVNFGMFEILCFRALENSSKKLKIPDPPART
jgi:hypothetical protein